jgi:Protein of unknown function (DUF1194)
MFAFGRYRLGLLLIAFWLLPDRLPAAEPVDLLLVLAADVSLSVSAQSHQLQRRGYADALNNPHVLDAIRSGPTGRIAVCFFEWSTGYFQNVLVDWMVVDGLAAARHFSDALLELPRTSMGATAIGDAITFAAAQLERAPYHSRRRIIDISGDGTSNSGQNPTFARDEVLDRGITINGLVILTVGPEQYLDYQNSDEHRNPEGGLANYYRANVIGGPGSFLMQADDFNSFGKAIVKKLIVEIAAESAR